VLPASATSRVPVSTLSTLVADERLDLARRLGAALGQAAHLAGHHREAAALLAGARGLHRGVQRQDVGLERDAVDDADDVGDLRRAGVDLVHRRHHLATTWPPRCATSAGEAGELVGLARRRRRSGARCRSAAPSTLAVCCRLLAVCSVRWLRSWLPDAELVCSNKTAVSARSMRSASVLTAAETTIDTVTTAIIR
jgi:hypothetical protein